MGNPRNTSGTPVLKQQAGSNSEPISQHSTSSQTEPEEDLSFSADTWLDENDDTNIMKQNYTEAVSFINACHQRVNTTNKNKHPNKTELFLLPMVENFIPMLPYLMGKESEEETVPKNKKRKAKGTFAVKKATDVPPDFIPVGDVKKVQTCDDENKAKQSQEIDVIKKRLEELTKLWLKPLNIDSPTSSKVLEVSPNPPSEATKKLKNKLCLSAMNIDSTISNKKSKVSPKPPKKQTKKLKKCKDTEGTSISSDAENISKILKPVWSSDSDMSLLSESSNIGSDSDEY